MRGEDGRTDELFSYVSCEARVPADHSLRSIRTVVDEALEVLSPEFERLYSKVGRPSIPPEKLLRALLLQAFFSIRSEWQLMEQLDYNLLFRWFVDLPMDASVWDASVFSKNRDRMDVCSDRNAKKTAQSTRKNAPRPIKDRCFTLPTPDSQASKPILHQLTPPCENALEIDR